MDRWEKAEEEQDVCFVFLGSVCVCGGGHEYITKIRKCLGGRKKREGKGEVPTELP